MSHRFLFVPVLSSIFLTQGFCSDESNLPNEDLTCFASKTQPMLEVKAGYFFFASSKMSDVYDEGGLDLQLSGSYPVWKWLQVYSSVEYLSKQGKSLNYSEKTSIWEIPISAGLKPVIRIIPQVQWYSAFGPRYFFFHQHNSSPYVKKHVNNNGIGFFVNTGFDFIFYKHFLVDIFGEYSWCRLKFNSSDGATGTHTQIGGFTFGGGLGYAF